MKGEAWVTIATTSLEAWKSIVLAKSLRNVLTSKPIVIGITKDISEYFGTFLETCFDAVIPIRMPEIKTGLKSEKSVIKLWCWKLSMFKKCIFIDPNTLILENPDELFKIYNEFSMSELNDLGMDNGIFVIKPNQDTFNRLWEFAKNKIELNSDECILSSYFQLHDLKKINSIETNIDIKITGPSSTHKFAEKIVHFTNSQPWENEETSLIKNAKTKWIEIFVHQILPCVRAEEAPTQKYLMSSIEEYALPATDGPANPLLTDNFVNDDLMNSFAIVGASARFPGANNLEEFWDLLKSGTDPIGTFPTERPQHKNNKWAATKNLEGGYLKCPIDEFDAKFFEISPRGASLIDPQQRLVLEVVWECLENALINPQDLQDTNTAAFLGIWQSAYDRDMPTDNLTVNECFLKYLGNAFSASSGRISHFLGLFGPNLGIESGCASSPSALHLACKSLRNLETNLAIVSGVNLILSSNNPIAGDYTDAETLSKSCRCKTFDESADGFVRAEACAAIVLKRYNEARLDGDRILGLVRGTALNIDGQGTSFGTPNAIAQARVFQEALNDAEVSPLEVTYIEAHGTGTFAGDPAEMSAIKEVYRSPQRTVPLLISSVKTNVGHAESCAGLVGLIKVLLAMKHQVLPPHLHFKNLNPKIDLASIPAKIPTELTDWKVEGGKPRIAALNAFGMCGTNVHVILQEPPEQHNPNERINIHSQLKLPQMVQISAKTPEALEEYVRRYIKYLEKDTLAGVELEDFAYHTNVCRANLSHRLSIIANDTSQLLEKLKRKSYLTEKIPPQKRQVGFLFPGQGSQYFGMTKSLYEKFNSFKIPFDQCSEIIRQSLGIKLQEILWGKNEYLDKSLYCQPAIFCVEYALAEFWKSFGIEPDYVLGHSVGEFAAATTAGLFSLRDALTLVVGRSKLVDKLEGSGHMLVVRSSLSIVLKFKHLFETISSDNWVDIAAINTDEEVVVSGTVDSIQSFEKFLKSSEIKTLRIQADSAFHSRQMDSILEDFEQIVKKVTINKNLKCKFVSATLGKIMDNSTDFGSDYWVRHLRDPVKFSDSIKLLWEECKIFIEIGPQPILLGLALGNISDTSCGALIPILRKNEEDTSAVFTALSKMYLAGMTINWKTWFGKRQKLLDLPTYPFQRQKYWFDLNESENKFMDSRIPHPLLGKLYSAPVPDKIFSLTYQSKHLSYLLDHKVMGRVILPGAAFVEMMLAAAKEIVTKGNGMEIPLAIDDLIIEAALELDENCQIQTISKSQSNEANELMYKISIHKQIGIDKWKKHASATFKPSSSIPGPKSIDLMDIKSRLGKELNMENFLSGQNEIGLDFGPKFQLVHKIIYEGMEILGSIKLPEDHKDYNCHPTIIDAMIQVFMLRFYIELGQEDEPKDLRLPVSIGKFIWLANNNQMTQDQDLFIYNRWEVDTEQEVILTDLNGICLGILKQVDTVKVSKEAFLRALNESKNNTPNFLEEIWVPKIGIMKNQIDTSLLQIPTKNSNYLSKSKAFTVGEKELKNSMAVNEAATGVFFLFLLRGIQECGWAWPKVGETIKPTDWVSQAPKTIQRLALFEAFMDILSKEGYLVKSENETQVFKIFKDLPEDCECEIKIKALIKFLYECDEPTGLFARRCDTHFSSLLKGEITPLSYLFPDDPKEYGARRFYTESELYKSLSDISVDAAIDTVEPLASQAKPGILRILEVGAGSGASSAQVIEKLTLLNIQYEYTFTDVSKVFLVEAQKKFENNNNLIYGVLNIEEDPLAQGYSPESFDMILAVQVVHATRNIVESLMNLNQLLRPNGIIILNETFSSNYFNTLSFGFLDGWWRFNDFRKTSPLVDSVAWAKCLSESGFEEPRIFNFHDSGAIIARKNKFFLTTLVSKPKFWIVISDNLTLKTSLIQKFNTFSRNTIQILYDHEISEVQKGAEENVFIVNPKLQVNFQDLIDQYGSNIEGILYIWTEAHEELTIQERQEIYCGGLLNLLQGIIRAYDTIKPKPKINLITKGLHSIGDDSYGTPDPSTAWALLKVLMTEYQGVYYVNLFDIQDDVDFLPAQIDEIFAKIWNFDKEHFIALRGDKKFVARLIESHKRSLPLTLPNSERFQAINPPTKSISDITISNAPKVQLENGQVEVMVKACSMNFRDLFLILKPEGFEIGSTGFKFGFDISGVVSAVGSKESKFKVGDEVFGGIQGAGYASHAIAREIDLFKKPQNLTFTSASTIPISFLTAMYSLSWCGKIKSTDHVLIHAATGGVGLAALQIAKQVGAEIYATAGSKKKRAYLASIGIKHIYHSRNTEFGDKILRDTNGQGVTVVLNSLTSPGFKEASLKACGQKARFIEIGKRDIWTETEINSLRPDVQYTLVDLATEMQSQEFMDNLSSFYDVLLKKLEEGTYKGLPHVTYPLDLIHEAFHFFQETKHIGKVVIKMPNASIAPNGTLDVTYEMFNSESTYMITGGLGGIGIEVAQWMLRSGARHILLVGRSLPNETNQRLFNDLNKTGNNLIPFQADVADISQCSGILEFIKQNGLPPLRGIFHGAGVLSDGLIPNQTWETFAHTLKSKVYAGMNLHSLTLDYGLEFFINFSSASAIFGTPGQSNHSAANKYLDSLTHYRSSIGLSAQTINFGAWSDIGAAVRHMKMTNEVWVGITSFTPHQGINAIEEIMKRNYKQQSVLGDVDWSVIKQYFKMGSYFDELHSDRPPATMVDFDTMIEKIKNSVPEERQEKIVELLEKIIKQILRLPENERIDKDQNFKEFGFDSLMGMEMKNVLQRLLKNKTLSINALENYQTVNSLAEHLTILMNSEDNPEIESCAETQT